MFTHHSYCIIHLFVDITVTIHTHGVMVPEIVLYSVTVIRLIALFVLAGLAYKPWLKVLMAGLV